MKTNTRRYEVLEASGGSYKRFYVWDSKEKRVIKNHIGKFEAIGIEHKLNERPFKNIPLFDKIPTVEPTAELPKE
jgi:hypothetical protein